MGQKYCRMGDQKPGLGWHVTWMLVNGKDLNQKLKQINNENQLR